jgi:phage tail sheath protein FI
MAGSVPILGELPTPPPSIPANIPTAITAFIDFFSTGPTDTPTPISSFFAFQQTFGGLDSRSEASYQIQQFFNTGGQAAVVLRIAPEPSTAPFAPALTSALTSLTLPFNLLCIPATSNLPADGMHAVMLAAQSFCAAHHAFYIADIPPSKIIATPSAIEAWFANTGLSARDCAAIYYPRLTIPDPLHQNAPREIGHSGAVAGIYANTDSARGVWTAPAGTHAILPDATPVLAIDDATNGQLNALAINAIRTFPTYGTVLWGARTTAGANTSDSDYKYVNIRRFAIYIEQSLTAGLQWVVFEPNTPVLWGSIRLAVGAFLTKLWQQGALQGSQPQQAFFVKCDATTMTQTDIDNGRLNIQIGVAPLRPAEFIILTIGLLTAHHP